MSDPAPGVNLPPLRLPLERDRIVQYLQELARCGALDGSGVFRPVYSKAWADARTRIVRWMEEAGLDVREDAVGNLFGRLPGGGPGAVVTGSHIDTVKHGGRYDGALGIVAGLAAVHALQRAYGPPRKPLEVVATCEEEGSRFPARMWGSRAMLGAIARDEPEVLTDAEGVAIGRAMRDAGYDPDAVPAAERRDIDAFLELHVEQGRTLDEARIPVGIVTAITGITQIRVRVSGQPDHAGTTPMDLRRDALAGAAEMVLRIEATASQKGRPVVATVGRMQVSPGAVNIVPGLVELTVDIRHPDGAARAELTRLVEAACREVAGRRSLDVDSRTLAEMPEAPLDRDLVMVLEEAARRQGVPYTLMVSGAGHDAQVLSRRFRAGMVFVPSQGGRSHSPAEFTAPEDIMPGADVLAAALHRLAY